MRYSLISLVFLAACSDGPSLAPVTPETGGDRAAPVLDLRAPLRGSLLSADATTVEVRGFVHDDSAVTLLVNGLRARVNGDGSFKIDVPIVDGVNLIHTVALDARHNQRSDTRAVLGGPLVDGATPVADGIVAHLDAAAVSAGGAALARRLGAIDLGAALARENPLRQNALPCIGSRADLDRLAHRVVRVEVSPVFGGLLVDAELADLALGLRVSFSTSCQAVRSETVSGEASRFHLRGVVHLGLADGRVVVDTADASAWLDGFRLDAAALPGRVADELEAGLADTLATRLLARVAGELPSLILRGLGAERGGGALEVDLRPTLLTLDQSGVTVAATSAARAVAGAGAVYLPRSTQRPAVEARSGLAVGIADDAVNQLVATAWAAGLLDGAPGAAAGAGYDAVELSPRLPPQLTTLADGRLRLVAGDVEAHLVARGATPRTVARLAVSVDTILEPRIVDGRLAVTPALPALFVDRLDGGDAAAPTGDAAELAATELVVAVGAALAELPLPATSAAVSLTAQRDPTSSGVGGYLVVSAAAGP